MKLFFPRELQDDERRAPLTPDFAGQLAALGAEVVVESGLGASCHFPDEQYRDKGAVIHENRHEALAEADMVLRLGKPPIEEVGRLKEGCIHISFLDPFNEPALVDEFAAKNISAFSMEMLPRTTRAQKMDALSRRRTSPAMFRSFSPPSGSARCFR
jgi:NAD(P) transhydrogenase subunit alpha